MVERVTALSTSVDDLVSAVSHDRLTLMLARRDDDGDDYDVYAATRSVVASGWGSALRIDELGTDGQEADAFLFADNRTVVFTRDEDLVIARRSVVGAAFGGVTPIDELNTADDDRDAWVSGDARYLVFSSDRSGAYRLYEARR
jgi:hypothetical protein